MVYKENITYDILKDEGEVKEICSHNILFIFKRLIVNEKKANLRNYKIEQFLVRLMKETGEKTQTNNIRAANKAMAILPRKKR